MEEGARPRLHLFDLPQEIKDQIYGYLVSDRYNVLVFWGDFKSLSILWVSKRTNREAMAVLQGRSWFIFDLGLLWRHPSRARKALTQYMMDVELLVGPLSTLEELAPVFRRFAGTWVLRRTCHVLVPVPSNIMRTYHVLNRDAASVALSLAQLEGFFGLMKSLTGFETVVLQINWERPRYINLERLENSQRYYGYDCDVTKLPKDIEDALGPTLGPAMPCSPVRKWERHIMTFKFSPRRFALERRSRRPRRTPITLQAQRWHKRG